MELRNEQNDILELVRKLEDDYIIGTTTIGKYVDFSQYENVEKIDAYINSKHISGDKDSKDRDKPFFNIVTAARNIWYRATDIDRKNIKIRATKHEQKVAAFVATLHLQEWMKRTGFGIFLNDWGRSLATYGSSVLKFVEKGGELIPSVVPWNRLITDTVDFEANPKIEVLWMTPAQLLNNKAYDQKIVKKLLDTRSARENTNKQRKDNKSDYIKIYEVHGQMEKSFLTGKKSDEDVYTQQMHVVTFLEGKGKGKFDDFTLYKGSEAKDPYMITHLIKEDGRAMSIGAVESLFEAQWMVNHSQKAIKDQLDLASKLIFQTSDGNFVGQNVLSAIETGDILIHANNEPLTKINNDATDITSLQNFSKQWEVLSQSITSTPDAMRGTNQPSGTAWRQVEALRQESHSLFELMTENKGLAIEQMLTQYIIPHLKKLMDTPDELAATLDSVGIMEFDSMYVPNEAIRRDNEQIKKTILSGEIAQNLDRTVLENDIKKELTSLGNQRFIKPSDLDGVKWKEALKDLEWEVDCEITEEARDKMAIMETLKTVFTSLANPNTAAALETPKGKFIFNKILEETGAVSELELSQIPDMPQMQQPSVGGSNVAPVTAQGAIPNGNQTGVPA
jgi:hypothetical protein